jgi:hypothetical protein
MGSCCNKEPTAGGDEKQAADATSKYIITLKTAQKPSIRGVKEQIPFLVFLPSLLVSRGCAVPAFLAQITEGMTMYKSSEGVQLAALERMALELDEKQPVEVVEANRETFGMSGGVEVAIRSMNDFRSNLEIQARSLLRAPQRSSSSSVLALSAGGRVASAEQRSD